jgi:hypothetical protein
MVQQEPLLDGIDLTPELHGYVATSAKSLATVNLISHRQDPILACWQYGLGRSVAFTSDPATSWTSAWNRWDQAERLWSQIGHYLTQDTAPAHFRTTATSENGTATIVLEALDEENRYVNSAEFAGAFLDSEGSNHRLNFEQTGPGRYEARFDLTGSAIGKILRIENGRIKEEALVQVPGGINREFQSVRDGKARLKELTGRILNSPVDKLQFGNGNAEDLLPLQNQLLFLAAMLFVIDVAARKIEPRMLIPHREERKTPVEVPSRGLGPLMERKMSAGKFRTAGREDRVPFKEMPPVSEEVTNESPEATPVDAENYIGRLKEAKKRRR